MLTAPSCGSHSNVATRQIFRRVLLVETGENRTPRPDYAARRRLRV